MRNQQIRRVSSAKKSRRAPVGSCGHRLETILVVQSAENRLRDDSMTITNLMAAGKSEAIVRRIGNAWPQAGVRAAPIVTPSNDCSKPHGCVCDDSARSTR